MTLAPDRSTLLLPFRRVAPDGARPFRVGVAAGQGVHAPWVDALLSFLKELPGTEVRLLPVIASSAHESKQPSWLTDRLYSASRARFDPFGDLAIKGARSATLESIEGIRGAGCDVLIWLAGHRDSTANPGALAKHGAFTVRFGKRNRAIPFWDEVAANEATSAIAVYWHDATFLRGRTVRTAETSTVQGLYLTQNAEEPLIAAIRALAGLCLNFREEGVRFEERLRSLPEEPSEAAPPADYPSTWEAGRFILTKLARSAELRWKNRGKSAQWFLALRPNSGASIEDPEKLDLTGFREIPLPPGSEAMADPFLWEHGGRNFLFFEEIASGSSRGRLGCVELSGDGSCSDMQIVLERPYHLSYPCVVPDRGDLFLLPESSEARRVDLYRFTRFPWEVEPVASLAEGFAFVDTTPLPLDGRWYFFTTTAQPFMETLLFWTDRLDGPWNLHPSSPISSSAKNSRSAGSLFWKNGRLFRPTQDCSVRYGYGIQVNEVTRLTPSEFAERGIGSVGPSWMPGLLGTHTWNENSKFQVLDGIRLQ